MTLLDIDWEYGVETVPDHERLSSRDDYPPKQHYGHTGELVGDEENILSLVVDGDVDHRVCVAIASRMLRELPPSRLMLAGVHPTRWRWLTETRDAYGWRYRFSTDQQPGSRRVTRVDLDLPSIDWIVPAALQVVLRGRRTRRLARLALTHRPLDRGRRRTCITCSGPFPCPPLAHIAARAGVSVDRRDFGPQQPCVCDHPYPGHYADGMGCRYCGCRHYELEVD